MYREHLKEQKIEVVPTYKIASKEQVKEGESPKWVAKKNLPAVSSSYHNYMVDCVIEDLMQHVLQVHDRPASDEDVSIMKLKQLTSSINVQLIEDRVVVDSHCTI